MISFDELCAALERWQRRSAGLEAAPAPAPAAHDPGATMLEMPAPSAGEIDLDGVADEDLN